MKKGMLTRILVGVALSLIFIGVWFCGRLSFGDIIQTVLFSIASVLCVYEITTILKKANYKFFTTPLYLLAAALPLMVTYGGYERFWATLFVFVLISLFMRMRDKEASNADMLTSLLVYAYPITLLAILVRTCTFGSVEDNRLAMLITFACPLLGDTFAYFMGVFFGKAKLCEHISPKKTIAGSFGSMIGSTLAGVIIYFIQNPVYALFEVQKPQGIALFPLIVLGFVLGFAGQIGDLFASCIKRFAGVKDYGSIFPGHGGMLDRIDSVLMCAPIVLIFFTIFTDYIY